MNEPTISSTRRDNQVFINEISFTPQSAALVGLSILNAALEVPTALQSGETYTIRRGSGSEKKDLLVVWE